MSEELTEKPPVGLYGSEPFGWWAARPPFPVRNVFLSLFRTLSFGFFLYVVPFVLSMKSVLTVEHGSPSVTFFFLVFPSSWEEVIMHAYAFFVFAPRASHVSKPSFLHLGAVVSRGVFDVSSYHAGGGRRQQRRGPVRDDGICNSGGSNSSSSNSAWFSCASSVCGVR